MVYKIYVGYHLTLLHTKYMNSGPPSFREDFISKVFSLAALNKQMIPHTTGSSQFGSQDKGII